MRNILAKEQPLHITDIKSDGKYILDEYELKSIVSKAINCHNFVLISIIGSKESGKTLFLDFLLNYLESDDRNSWPKDQELGYYSFWKNSDLSKKHSIMMWSEPYILVENGIKTAVLFMDTFNIFKSRATINFNGLVEDIISLFLTTSSTVIYIKEQHFLVNN